LGALKPICGLERAQNPSVRVWQVRLDLVHVLAGDGVGQATTSCTSGESIQRPIRSSSAASSPMPVGRPPGGGANVPVCTMRTAIAMSRRARSSCSNRSTFARAPSSSRVWRSESISALRPVFANGTQRPEVNVRPRVGDLRDRIEQRPRRAMRSFASRTFACASAVSRRPSSEPTSTSSLPRVSPALALPSTS